MLIMRKAFQMFDTQKTGFIETIKISTILNTMGQLFDEGELQDLIDEEDPESTGRVNFDGFANIASNFLQEEEDAEAMQQELKEAFRLYDREGNGYITTRYRDIGEDGAGSCYRYGVTSVLFHQLHTHTHIYTHNTIIDDEPGFHASNAAACFALRSTRFRFLCVHVRQISL